MYEQTWLSNQHPDTDEGVKCALYARACGVCGTRLGRERGVAQVLQLLQHPNTHRALEARSQLAQRDR